MVRNSSAERLQQLVALTPPPLFDSAANLRLALQMMQAGIEMMKLTLARRYPDESPAEIHRRWRHWLEYQPSQPGLSDASYRFEGHAGVS